MPGEISHIDTLEHFAIGDAVRRATRLAVEMSSTADNLVDPKDAIETLLKMQQMIDTMNRQMENVRTFFEKEREESMKKTKGLDKTPAFVPDK